MIISDSPKKRSGHDLFDQCKRDINIKWCDGVKESFLLDRVWSVGSLVFQLVWVFSFRFLSKQSGLTPSLFN